MAGRQLRAEQLRRWVEELLRLLAAEGAAAAEAVLCSAEAAAALGIDAAAARRVARSLVPAAACAEGLLCAPAGAAVAASGAAAAADAELGALQGLAAARGLRARPEAARLCALLAQPLVELYGGRMVVLKVS
jgi:hypothetical protein